MKSFYLGEFTVVEKLQQRTLAHRTVADQYQTELVIEHHVGHGCAAVGHGRRTSRRERVVFTNSTR